MNTTYPKISIVTVTYNAEHFLEQTILSILKQKYPNIEYIIIDGNSSDKTVEIIKKYEKYISYWTSESDKGIYDAMNKGISISTGEWINFMNAGDSFVEEDTICKIMNELEPETDLIAGDIYYIAEDNKKSYKSHKEIYYPLDNMFCYHQTLFTKTYIMKNIPFSLEFSIAADYDFVLNCFLRNYNFQFVNFPIANFLAGGISEQNVIKARIEDLFIQSKYLDKVDNIFNSNAYNTLKSLENSSHNMFFNRLFNNLLSQCYHFHLEKKNFVLYGYGNIGKIIYSNFKNNIKYVIDQQYDILKKQYIKPITVLKNSPNELIVISVLGREKEIIDELINTYNIRKELIIIFNL
ncbi:glycosyltransferase family 2 protein [Halarcobacter sp.]|uniref:glycosyltransferase family 2 protein n=1 Tax=Halarcobacter sp. TaxID=2321133 RepID=UPI0029F4B28D|nr:glycosyltransferase family 2 protein [Halarcobacter sp.]